MVISRGIFKLFLIGFTASLNLAGTDYRKAMGTNNLGRDHRDIFIKIERPE